MNRDYEKILEQARNRYGENKKYFQKLKKLKSGQLDPLMRELHEQVFQEIDCLKCANCCRGTGPLLRERDIARLARTLRMKPGDFTGEYLKIDEDQDYVFQSLPCPFLREGITTVLFMKTDREHAGTTPIPTGYHLKNTPPRCWRIP